MTNLLESLNVLGYNKQQAESIIQIFHFTGAFDQQIKDQPLSAKKIDAILSSNLDLDQDATNLDIAVKFNEIGQTKWRDLRKEGERQEMSAISIKNPEITEFFKVLNISQEIKPNKDCELYFVFGASEAGLINRIDFLKDNLGDEIGNKKIIFLGGKRELWPKYSGDNEFLIRSIPGENVTFDLIKKLNPNIDIEDFKAKINEFFESRKQDFIDKKIDVTKLRKEIIENFSEGIIWPTESDLERFLAQKILKIENPKVIEGQIDPSIGRPTTETTLKAIKDDLKQDPNFSDINFETTKICFISSQPHILRQTKLAESLSGFINVSGSGRGCESSLNPNNVSGLLEALLGEINALSGIALQKNKALIKPLSVRGSELATSASR